jgi:ATP-GRASP peptide maturase of grasp-with-spasm system
MILILSGDGDASTDVVVQYLLTSGYPHFRLNAYDLLRPDFNISLTSQGTTTLSCRGKNLPVNEVGVVWHRKFGFFRNSKFYEKAAGHMFHENLDNLSKEFSTLLGTTIGIFENKQWLTNPKYINLNKFQVLEYASRCGLNIPESHIIANKEHIKNLKESGAIITKSIRDPWMLKDHDSVYTMYTSEIDNPSIEDVPETFFPSLVQRKIEKEYELRVFCIQDKTYAMAIFSQNDKQTELDFRRYNDNKPNRAVPYKLPVDIEEQVLKLSRMLNLNCCSIDLIKGKNGIFYFLEVNPTGQFGMVEFPCNYPLHKIVAQTLMELDKKGIANESVPA